MTHILGILAIATLLGILMYTGIRNSKRPLPPKLGMYVRAVLYVRIPLPDAARVDNSVTGEIVSLNKGGTMNVRNWETGIVYTCLDSVFELVPREEADIMRKLRKEADEHFDPQEHWENIRPHYETAPGDARTDDEIREAFRKAQENPNYDPDMIH